MLTFTGQMDSRFRGNDIMIGRVAGLGANGPRPLGTSAALRAFMKALAVRIRELTLDRRFNLLQRTWIIQRRQIARIFAFGNRLNAPPQ